MNHFDKEFTMKKLFSLAMIGMMCSVGFTGCGDKKKEEKKTEVKTTDTTPDGKTVEKTSEKTEKTETKTP
ncbi:MAG: hypothetical protein QM811_12830 [Pirellulales bacterium]